MRCVFWDDIVEISAGERNTIGLKSDGTVVVAGDNTYGQIDDSKMWKNIVSVAAGGKTVYGVKANGSVVAAGSNASGQAKVSSWSDIVAVSAGYSHVIGLKSDGTVVAAGSNTQGECNVANWSNITAVSAGSLHSVGLKADGRVVAAGLNKDGQCNVSSWKNIIAIGAGMRHTVGVKEDGSMVAIGLSSSGQCNVPKGSVDLLLDPASLQSKPLYDSEKFYINDEEFISLFINDLRAEGYDYDAVYDGSSSSDNVASYIIVEEHQAILQIFCTLNPESRNLDAIAIGFGFEETSTQEVIRNSLNVMLSIFDTVNVNMTDEKYEELLTEDTLMDVDGYTVYSGVVDDLSYTLLFTEDAITMALFPCETQA